MRGERICPGCGKGPLARMWEGYCNPCYKRLIWRPRNEDAVEKERETSRRWKREHLGQPGRPAA